ncbi:MULTISPECIES: hypothetical protein [Colwellia]|nr:MULTISPECIES: hypothetical protein [Colwellia]
MNIGNAKWNMVHPLGWLEGGKSIDCCFVGGSYGVFQDSWHCLP